MSLSIEAAKAGLRSQVRTALRAMTAAAQAEASAKAREVLRGQALWQRARSILFFAPLPGELDVWPLVSEALATGKEAAFPRFEPAAGCYAIRVIRDVDKDFELGRFGIREPASRCPVARNRLDLLLVPGLAFDPHGRRLGRGKGYYDRLLSGLVGKRCGVAFDEQIVSEIPVGPQDMRMNCVFTPTRWIDLGRPARQA